MRDLKKIPHACQLEAWELWKQVCSISGCIPEAHPEIPEEQAQLYYDYLCAVIIGSFSGALQRKFGLFRTLQENDKKNYPFSELPQGQALIPEFDCLITEYQPLQKAVADQQIPNGVKYFKDKIWQDAAQSSDPAAQVIAGKVKFLVMSMLGRFLSKYLTVEAGRGKLDGTYQLVLVDSIHEPAYQTSSHSPNREDVLPDISEKEEPVDEKEESTAILAEFLETLSLREKLILLAGCVPVNVTDPVVQRALGVKKDGCSQANLSLKRKMQRMPIFDASGLSFLKDELFSQLAPEKSAQELFSMIKEQRKGELYEN